MIFHCVDRASRWHAAQVVTGKHDNVLWEALMAIWIGIHGPMQTLVVDGERGIAKRNYFHTELKARGIKLKERAPRQHARYIERRGALVKHAMRVMEEQI